MNYRMRHCLVALSAGCVLSTTVVAPASAAPVAPALSAEEPAQGSSDGSPFAQLRSMLGQEVAVPFGPDRTVTLPAFAVGVIGVVGALSVWSALTGSDEDTGSHSGSSSRDGSAAGSATKPVHSSKKHTISSDSQSSQGQWSSLELQREKLVAAINDTRRDAGQKPVVWNKERNGEAQQWADGMAARRSLQHASGGFDGEIIAQTNSLSANTAAGTVELWNYSPGHHRIMHDDAYTQVTVGVARDPQTDKVYSVARFFRPER